jgi:hypothetical protein
MTWALWDEMVVRQTAAALSPRLSHAWRLTDVEHVVRDKIPALINKPTVPYSLTEGSFNACSAV